MTKTIKAPWNEDQVTALELRQADESKHQYTCERHSKTGLVPTKDGWKCPEKWCRYKQNWAHAVDMKQLAKTSVASLLETMDMLCQLRFVLILARVHLRSGGRVKTYSMAGYYKVGIGIEDQVQQELLRKIVDNPDECVVEPPYDPKSLGLDRSFETIDNIEFVTLENREVHPAEMAALAEIAKYAKDPEEKS